MKALRKERTDAEIREMKVEIRANNEKLEVLQGTLVSRMDIHQPRTEPAQEDIKANMDSYYEKFMATVKVDQENIEAIMEACQEKTEATDLGANPEEIGSRVGAEGSS
jgi:hypothetical protein